MADEKAEKKNGNKKEAKKEVKPKVITSVSLIKEVVQTEHKDRKAVVTEVLALAKKRGVSENIRGKALTETNISSLLAAMCRDINSAKSGWWNTWEVIEDKDKFQMKPKSTNL